MIFAQNLIVIELFGSFGIPTLFLLAKALGFQYGCLVDHNGRNQYSEKFNGIMVDIDKFQAQYNGIMVDVARLRDLVAEMLHIYSDPSPEYCLPY